MKRLRDLRRPKRRHSPRTSEEAKTQRLAALLRMSEELAAVIDEDEICRRVVHGLHDTLGYDVVALFLIDETTGDRVVTASVGYPGLPGSLAPGQGLSERPLLDGKLHYAADVSLEPGYSLGVGGSELDVPVHIDGKTLGVLVAEDRQKGAFDEQDFKILTAVAQQAGLALEKARLLTQERLRADELKVLYATMTAITAERELPVLLRAIVQSAAELLQATGGELGLYDEATQEICIVVSHNLGDEFVGLHHKLGEGAMGRVAATGEPLIIDDYQTWEGGLSEYPHIHATLATPLVVGERLLGVFSTVSTDPARRFDHDDLHLLTMFAQQAAIAVENARLFDQAEKEIKARKRYEKEILHQKEYFEALFVNNPAAVVTADLDGNVVTWNPMAKKLFGYSTEEAIGTPINDLVANSDAVRADAERYSESAAHRGRVQSTTKRTRRDGSLIDVELLSLPVVVAGEKIGSITIFVDITEIQRTRRVAEAANRAKSTFLANMSHELRTPLNAIMGFTQLMEYDENLTDRQRENIRIVNQSGEHLLTLINSVLEMSKIEAGQVTLQEQNIDLYSLLDDLLAILALRAERKELRLRSERAESVPRYVCIDGGKLRQVLINLLENAIKFTQQGEVALHVTATEPVAGAPESMVLHFKVKDTGPGIPLEAQQSMFEPFVQIAGDQQPQEGTGLGLSISREYVRLLGGDLSVNSRLGVGSTFEFTMPVRLADAPEAHRTRPIRHVTGLKPDQPTYRLLVVDDSDTDRHLLVRLLTDVGTPPQGFEVREAANGQEAIDIWEHWQPHLIWMDMRMPVLDGIEATRRIKAGGKNTVIVALTASAFEDERERILAEGCDDFIRKPFRRHEIFDALGKHLDARFVYADGPAFAADRSYRTPQPAMTADAETALAALPAALIDDLRQATLQADIDVISELVEEIGTHNAALAATLDGLAREFNHDAILALLPIPRAASG